MIDFIVPSIGRPTLKRALESLINQTNPDWKCYVGFDGLTEDQVDSNILVNDSRITYFYLGEKLGTTSHHGNAGEVRNKIISLIDKPNPWTAFLDDDDSLSPIYIDLLKLNITKTDPVDCYVFRMNHNNNIIPEPNLEHIVQNNVGISFCVKTSFMYNHNIKFENDNAEDFKFLKNIEQVKGIIKLLPYVTYFVGR
jgi:hypothetical protein